MKKRVQNLIDNSCFVMPRQPQLWLFVILQLLLTQCLQKDEPTLDDKQQAEKIKSTYQIKGLSDGFLKAYETYSYFDLDTTSRGDTAAYFFTDYLEGNKLHLTVFLDEAFQPRVYEVEKDFATVGLIVTFLFDNISCLADSGTFTVKTVNDKTIEASIDMSGRIIGGKRYRITGENIIASPKGYLGS